jgi:hypothetical protein
MATDSFGTFLDTLQRLRSQRNPAATSDQQYTGAAVVMKARAAALVMTILAAQKDPISFPDLMEKTSLDPCPSPRYMDSSWIKV